MGPRAVRALQVLEYDDRDGGTGRQRQLRAVGGGKRRGGAKTQEAEREQAGCTSNVHQDTFSGVNQCGRRRVLSPPDRVS